MNSHEIDGDEAERAKLLLLAIGVPADEQGPSAGSTARFRKEVEIGKYAHGQGEAAIMEALESVEPGDRVIYHRGPIGSAPGSIKFAASRLMFGGVCMLAQRVSGDRSENNVRIVDYLAIKMRRKI